MIRVLHLLPMNKLSGAERMGLLICKHMSQVESYVLTGGQDLAEFFQKEEIQVTYINFSIKNLPKVIKRLNQMIIENQIDIIHAHDNIASLSAYLAKKRYGLKVKIVSHIHNCYPWLESNGIHKHIDRLIRPQYDFNITCGQIVYDYYEKFAPYFNSKKTCTLSNAIDINHLGVIDEQEIVEVRKAFDIPDNKIIIGYIGRLSEQKGMIPFIQVLKDYKKQFEDCRFLIVGNGEQEDEIKHLIKESGLQDLFIFTGFQENVYPFYQLINIFFLPSLYEGLPMVLLEAVGSGVPTISMNVGSINEVIIHKETGILIKKEQRTEFIEQLIQLKNNSDYRQKLSKAGMKHVKSKFSLEEYNQSLYSVYQSLIS